MNDNSCNGNDGKNTQIEFTVPIGTVRPFNKENPDWKREYCLLMAAVSTLGFRTTEFLRHESTHNVPTCPASMLLFLQYDLADDAARLTLDRVPKEFLSPVLRELVEILKAEAEADKSSDAS